MGRIILWLALLVVSSVGNQGVPHYNNGLGQTPAMGWSSWSNFRKNITDSIIRQQALAMSTSLQSHGYTYVNVDDGWQVALTSGCDAFGRFLTDSSKFPNGIKPVADYVHSLGLKFGIYVTPGVPYAAWAANSPVEGTTYHIQDILLNPLTPALPFTDPATGTPLDYQLDFTKPGAQAYVNSFANLFASWGVDYVKMDFINVGTNGIGLIPHAQAWSTALLNCGRPIYYTICNNLQIQEPFGSQWAAMSNGWRGPNGDIEGNNVTFQLPATNWNKVYTNRISLINTYRQLAGPGGWNDLDSVCLGYGDQDGLTPGERQLYFGYWAMISSPLLIGADLTAMDPGDLALLQNDEIIAVDQTPRQGVCFNPNARAQWYWKPLADGGVAVLIMQLGTNPGDLQSATVNWSDIGLSGVQPVRDLMARADLPASSGPFTVTLGVHQCTMLKIGGSSVPTTPPPPPPPPPTPTPPPAPVAVLAALPTSGAIPLTVAFSASGSTVADGNSLSYAWDFGDGTNGSGPTVSHVYNTAGTFTATLTVMDSVDQSDTASVSITASAASPSPSPDPQSPPASSGGGGQGGCGLLGVECALILLLRRGKP